MIFTETIHDELAILFDVPGYAGYRPAVKEAPNGDMKACPACAGKGWYWESKNGEQYRVTCEKSCRGTGIVPNVDCDKRYLHVALKYAPPAWAERHLARAHWEACKVADALKVPDAYYPRPENGTLRVLEYPAGAGSAEHTDFDLFTVLCWRSTPEDLEIDFAADPRPTRAETKAVREWSPGLHIGEIGELVGLGPATPHRVPARPYVQRSIVYFAMPANGARLPVMSAPEHGGTMAPTVAEWVAERIARSRYT